MDYINTQDKMDKEQPIIVGLDIGTTKVVAIAGRKNSYGKIDILGLGMADSAGVDHGVVLNIEECTQSIENALNDLRANNPELEIHEVYVGIAGGHIKSIQAKGERVRLNPEEEITKEDIRALIEDQRQLFVPAGDQIIDIIPKEFFVDNTVGRVNPIGMPGVKIGATFHVVTGDKMAIRNIKRCVDKIGLNTKDLVLQPLASAAAILTEEDLEAGVAVIDIGGGTTDLAVFHDGILKHTAVIPYAGKNITEDIRKGLQVLRAQAESMKTRFGAALATEAKEDAYIVIPGLGGMPQKEIAVQNLAAIIEARMREILEFAMDELQKLNIDHELFGGIILTGGGSELKHLIQLTEFVTGLNARIGYPVEHVSSSHIEELHNPRFSTCIGLILRGYEDYESGKFEKNSNRFPESKQEEAREDEYVNQDESFFSNDTQGVKKKNVSSEVPEKSEELETENLPVDTKTRENTINKIFNSIKRSIMVIFEDLDDDEFK